MSVDSSKHLACAGDGINPDRLETPIGGGFDVELYAPYEALGAATITDDVPVGVMTEMVTAPAVGGTKLVTEIAVYVGVVGEPDTPFATPRIVVTLLPAAILY